MSSLRTPAFLLGALCFLLTGCPDPSPFPVVVGAETAREPDGSVRVNGIVSNQGYYDFDGTLCLTARWLRGVEATDPVDYCSGDKDEPEGLVDEATVCVKRELKQNEDAFFELRSTRPLEGDDLLIELSVSHRGDDDAKSACSPTLLGMPPSL
jgi:hypothetical protein